MNQLPPVQADINNISTWVKYCEKLCAHCMATCCRLPVEVKAEDLIRMRLMDEFELGENLKVVARRLMKQHLVGHYHAKTKLFTLARMANGDCVFLDSQSRRCAVYPNRPDTCRNHPRIGPRAGYCAFTGKHAPR